MGAVEPEFLLAISAGFQESQVFEHEGKASRLQGGFLRMPHRLEAEIHGMMTGF